MNTGLPAEMFDHYGEDFDEVDRLTVRGRGELERIRTQDVLSRQLPEPPAVVLDVGGAAGVYALWLAKLGYQVHLIDPVPRHVEQAGAASAAQPDNPLASCTTGDARELSYDDQSADAVLMLGPLYHLTERADRVQALREARRVLRPGGVVCAAAISRYASMLDGLAAGMFDDPLFADIVRQDLRDGQHRNPTGEPKYFTTTYFHRPADLEAELVDAGFVEPELTALEGPVGWTASFESAWPDERKRALLLEFLRTTEAEPGLLGCSPHFMAIGHNSAP